MKTKPTVALSAFLLLAVASPLLRASESVDSSQLPEPVKKSLAAQHRGAEVAKITRENVNGRTVYDIELERKDALNPTLRIAADGDVLRDTAAPRAGNTDALPVVDPEFGTPAALPTVALSEVSTAAQTTIRQTAAGREIVRITRDRVEGRDAYAVEFKESGWNPRAYIAEDGTLVRPPEKPPLLLIGQTLSDLPGAVRETVKREIGANEIVKIDRSTRRDGNEYVYQIDVKDTHGTYRLQVAQDGRVIDNPRPAATLPGRR